PVTAPTTPTHHVARVDGADLHHVRAGDTGSPVLLVHGSPETWWAFHQLLPHLARAHHVLAVDLRGFGDSSVASKDHGSTAPAGAGGTGWPVVVVQGLPETWWPCHRLLPRLARAHRVAAVDLRGLGDSRVAEKGHGSAVAAADLHGLSEHLRLGPVHLGAQVV